MVPNIDLHILTIHFEPLKRRQFQYKGQDAIVPRCPLYGGSTVVHILNSFAWSMFYCIGHIFGRIYISRIAVYMDFASLFFTNCSSIHVACM